MLRLHPKANAEDLSCVHDPLNAVATNTLHRVGEELPHTVSKAHACGAVTSSVGSCFCADSQLFGEDEDADQGSELDEAEKQGENCKESWYGVCTTLF